ncbi:coiled-coil domain-containing protein 51 isoform X1 [Vombatus ursinus]|uniref:Coiled-coil domain containing 51 n=2 Tax=Vombatus ursinus TaxID=29139 RepID=A0A4X2LSS0_VOMUR|nr:coiled-coil domain-containing protein 51 isoform X1 [Vombatus ursinus]
MEPRLPRWGQRSWPAGDLVVLRRRLPVRFPRAPGLMMGHTTILAMQRIMSSPQKLELRSQRMKLLSVRSFYSPGPIQRKGKTSAKTAIRLYHRLTEMGRTLGQNFQQRISSVAKTWWDSYEEFVGLNEVREAQGNVTEAEKEFMVARGIVRKARDDLEVHQARLKEIRDRLDRVSREDTQYLELATLEHRLLQEEKRLRTAHANSEESEREKFSLFSAAVRESHEKERTRAEKTKNWSLIGSVLGALIGVAGSTYVNRVRLQELKSLLLESQTGPVSLQEAVKEQTSSHNMQSKDLSDLIEEFRSLVHTGIRVSSGAQEDATSSGESLISHKDTYVLSASLKEQLSQSQQVRSCLQSLQEQLTDLDKKFSQMVAEVQLVKATARSQLVEQANQALLDSSLDPRQSLVAQGMILELSDMEQRLEAQVNRNSMYSTVLTCTMFAAMLPVLYIFFRTN